jgi:dipeptidyl aminopeptidase/acylaminoacyl peptidase
MQSERYYAALKGNGATARLVMLPYESHGYRARESILHMAAEQEKWLDTYVKGEPLPDGLERAAASPTER